MIEIGLLVLEKIFFSDINILWLLPTPGTMI
jgi:hypothetical protein